MLTLEPEDLPVYAKLCERQKKVLFVCTYQKARYFHNENNELFLNDI